MTKSWINPAFFLPSASLPPRFVAWWFSDPSVAVAITSETILAWRRAGHFGPRAAGRGRLRLTRPELFTATGAWSPRGLLADLQRKPYPSECVAARLGLTHRTALARFRDRKIPGGFKLGSYWYARAAEFDAAQARP